jgi:hypothetical protein
VFDRGIVSEENLAAIRKRGGQYLVGTPRSQMKQFEGELLKDDWTQVRPEVEVKKVAIPQGEETFILCRTSGRKEKEKAIRDRFSARMEDALKRLAKTIETGRLKDRYKMERRLGRIQARHPQVNDLYEVALRDTPEGVRLHWALQEDHKVWRGLREGAYMLRTNLQAGTAEDLWSRYMPVDRGRGIVPRAEKRAVHPALVPSTGAAREGPCYGGLPWLRSVGHTQASAEASARDRPAAFQERGHQCAAVVGDEGARSAVNPAERRHRPAHHRRS